jgi:hypothetical protein
VEWVPKIMDLDFLPDIGRMNGKWLSGVARLKVDGANEKRSKPVN